VRLFHRQCRQAYQPTSTVSTAFPIPFETRLGYLGYSDDRDAPHAAYTHFSRKPRPPVTPSGPRPVMLMPCSALLIRSFAPWPKRTQFCARLSSRSPHRTAHPAASCRMTHADRTVWAVFRLQKGRCCACEETLSPSKRSAVYDVRSRRSSAKFSFRVYSVKNGHLRLCR
jgi:hypothetical protein